jgi:hypothetical protein
MPNPKIFLSGSRPLALSALKLYRTVQALPMIGHPCPILGRYKYAGQTFGLAALRLRAKANFVRTIPMIRSALPIQPRFGLTYPILASDIGQWPGSLREIIL